MTRYLGVALFFLAGLGALSYALGAYLDSVAAPEPVPYGGRLHLQAEGAWAVEADSLHLVDRGEDQAPRVVVWLRDRPTECVELPDGRTGWAEVDPLGTETEPLRDGLWLPDDCRIVIRPGETHTPPLGRGI